MRVRVRVRVCVRAVLVCACACARARMHARTYPRTPRTHKQRPLPVGLAWRLAAACSNGTHPWAQ